MSATKDEPKHTPEPASEAAPHGTRDRQGRGGRGRGQGRGRRRRFRWGLVALGFAALVGVVLLFTEVIWYFPLTPLSLDTQGRTRLPAPGPGRARLLFVGDILLGDAGQGIVDKKGYDYPFGTTKQILRAADLTIGNQEGPISASAPREGKKRWSYRSSPKAAAALSHAGFDLMTLANNHVRDCGDQGVRDTITHLRAAGVTPFGAGPSPEEAHAPALVNVQGVRLALFGYLAHEQSYRGQRTSHAYLAARSGRAGVALGARPAVRRDVRQLEARGGADLKIAVLHQGDRYDREPGLLERTNARILVDAGFDAVVVHGSHLAGPVEIYQGRPILHGVGNFAFLSGNVRARFSVMAALDLDLAKKRFVGLQLLPIYTVNWNPWVWFQTRVILGYPARMLLGDLARRSIIYGARLRLRDGPTRLVGELL